MAEEEDEFEEEANYTAFAGVVVEEDEEQRREQEIPFEAPKDPIKASVEVADESGNIEISFSRSIVLDLDSVGLDNEQGPAKRRILSEIYSAEEKLKLANILTIEYQTDAEDGEERSQIARKEVVTATD